MLERTALADGTSKNAATDPPLQTAQVTPGDVRAFLVCVLFAVVSSRYLAPSLPGAASGIGPLIDAAERAAAVSTQFVTFLGLVMGLGLLAVVTQDRNQLVLVRTVTTVSSGALYVVVALSTLLAPGTMGLSLPWRFSMAGACLCLVLTATGVALQNRSTRAVGLMLASTALTALTLLASRYLALTASAAANSQLYATARWLGTLATIFDTGNSVIVLLWLVAWGRRRAFAWMGGLGALVLLSSLVERLGSRDGARTWEVVIRRALLQFDTQPVPMLLGWLRHANDVVALGLALSLPFLSGVPRATACIFCAALLSRSSVDIPLLALVLSIAASLSLASTVSTGNREPVTPSSPGRAAR